MKKLLTILNVVAIVIGASATIVCVAELTDKEYCRRTFNYLHGDGTV